MKKVNFKTITIKDINGNDIVSDFQKQLGNMLYMQGQNIEESELDDKEVAIVRKAVQGYSYVARTAIEQALG